ncbi:hypothetical protein [Streptomyces sp. CA-111067]|uniref:hypothetical protein n=1 Tax=Streptomyces sp. CA-111067 TaxID=3240046 RepID=UPI003D961D0C
MIIRPPIGVGLSSHSRIQHLSVLESIAFPVSITAPDETIRDQKYAEQQVPDQVKAPRRHHENTHGQDDETIEEREKNAPPPRATYGPQGERVIGLG